MTQAVCTPATDALDFGGTEAPAEPSPDANRSSIQSRWQHSPRIDVHFDLGYPVLDLGSKEIWDGSDLCLLRDTLVDLCQERGSAGGGQGVCHEVGIEMKSVKGIPTGFFGERRQGQTDQAAGRGGIQTQVRGHDGPLNLRNHALVEGRDGQGTPLFHGDIAELHKQ